MTEFNLEGAPAAGGAGAPPRKNRIRDYNDLKGKNRAIYSPPVIQWAILGHAPFSLYGGLYADLRSNEDH